MTSKHRREGKAETLHTTQAILWGVGLTALGTVMGHIYGYREGARDKAASDYLKPEDYLNMVQPCSEDKLVLFDAEGRNLVVTDDRAECSAHDKKEVLGYTYPTEEISGPR